MPRLVIEYSPALEGTVEIGGAKNATLPVMAASLLAADTCTIEGAPRVTDVATMEAILRALGREVVWRGGVLRISPGREPGWAAPYELVRLMRASVCVLGPLLATMGRARVAMPGGCVIGPRPIDLHLKGLEALGAVTAVDHGDIIAETPGGLAGKTIHLAGAFGSSVLATDNVMMAAVLAKGTTVIEHAACEPEVVDLAEFLITMGARIAGAGTPVIRIDGVERLRGAHHRVIPDRIEAGTCLIAAALVGRDVAVRGARFDQLGAVVDKLQEAGVGLEAVNGSIRVHRTGPLRSVDVTTLPFPGFPTDLQAPMTALLSLADGVSVVTEKVYPERFMHVPELNRMGAQIRRQETTILIKGVPRLSGAPVAASDLRASAALVVAGLAADNQTDMTGVEHLDRGYDGLVEKLAGLGAKIRREEQ